MSQLFKQYNTIGCCGIDCGLCPRFISKSDSACPGCGATEFYAKHPTCGLLTCCVKKNGLEVCSQCNAYPCNRFDSEKNGCDSFVTHLKVFVNHDLIKTKGLRHFMKEQKQRIDLLEYLIVNFDNGRSKIFFCQACALLPIEKIYVVKQKSKLIKDSFEIQSRNKAIKDLIQEISNGLNIDLKLRTKKK